MIRGFTLEEFAVDNDHLDGPWQSATIRWRVTTLDDVQAAFLTLDASPGTSLPINFENELTVSPALTTTYRLVAHSSDGSGELGALSVKVIGDVFSLGSNALLTAGGGVTAAVDGEVRSSTLKQFAKPETGVLLRERGDHVAYSADRLTIRLSLLASIGTDVEPRVAANVDYGLTLDERHAVRAQRLAPLALNLPPLGVGTDGLTPYIDRTLVNPDEIARYRTLLASHEEMRQRFESIVDGAFSDSCRTLTAKYATPEYWCAYVGISVQGVLFGRGLRGHFVSVPGVAYDVGVGPDGAVWVVGGAAIPGGFGVYRFDGASWQQDKNAAGTRIAVGPAGPWLVDSSGRVLRLDSNVWTQVAPEGSAQDIGVGADGTAWKISPQQSIARWDGAQWISVDGAAVRIAVRPDGTPIVVNEGGNIYRRVGDTWVYDYNGSAKDVGAGADGTEWVIGNRDGNDNGVWRYLGAPNYLGYLYEQVDGQGSNIAVGPDGATWTTTSDGAIFRRRYL